MSRSEMDFRDSGDITNYNVPKDCCCHAVCDRTATRFHRITVNGMELFVVLCAEHDDELFNRTYHEVDTWGRRIDGHD